MKRNTLTLLALLSFTTSGLFAAAGLSNKDITNIVQDDYNFAMKKNSFDILSQAIFSKFGNDDRELGFAHQAIDKLIAEEKKEEFKQNLIRLKTAIEERINAIKLKIALASPVSRVKALLATPLPKSTIPMPEKMKAQFASRSAKKPTTTTETASSMNEFAKPVEPTPEANRQESPATANTPTATESAATESGSWWSPTVLWESAKSAASNVLEMAKRGASEVKTLKEGNTLRKSLQNGYKEIAKSLTKVDTGKMGSAVAAMRLAADPARTMEERQKSRLEAYGSLDQLNSPINVIFGRVSKKDASRFVPGQLAKILQAAKLTNEAEQVTNFGKELHRLIELAKEELAKNPVAKESFFSRAKGFFSSGAQSEHPEGAAASKPSQLDSDNEDNNEDTDTDEEDMLDKGIDMLEQILALQKELPCAFALVQADPTNPENLEKVATLLLGEKSIIMKLLVNFGGETGKAAQEKLALIYSYIDFILREKRALSKACAVVAASVKKS